MKYGLHFRSWDGFYRPENLKECLQQAKALGAETFEVFPPACVLECEREKIKEVKKHIEDVGLELLLTFRYPSDMDIASERPQSRRKGIDCMRRALEGAAELGVREIGGIVYSIWPYRFDDDMITPEIKQERTKYSVESMKEIMSTAEACSVYLNAEVLNRFEHYLMNTVEEGVRYCEQVGSPNLKLLLDVFHMNIEEDSIPDAIRLAGKYIGHFHVSEPNRKIPFHRGRINWPEVGRALRESEYTGTVTLEPILLFLGQASYNSRMWRNHITDLTMEKRLGMLKDGLDFIKGQFEQEEA